MTLSHTWAKISNSICSHQQPTVPTHTQYHYSIPLLTHCSMRPSHVLCRGSACNTAPRASDSSPKPSHYPYAWLTWTVMTLSLERQSRTPLDNPSLPETCNKILHINKVHGRKHKLHFSYTETCWWTYIQTAIPRQQSTFLLQRYNQNTSIPRQRKQCNIVILTMSLHGYNELLEVLCDNGKTELLEMVSGIQST
jgi:hypothetical protein